VPDPAPDQSPLPVLAAEAARLGLDLPAATLEAFARYLDLVIAWNRRAGLTAIEDREEIQRRHFGESLALLVALRDAGIIEPGVPCRVADIGPGGGFPGLPLRIVEPALELVLIESQARRCRFLRETAAALGLDGVEVVHARAEEAGRDPTLRGTFDLVVARAVAAMPVLVEYALPLLRQGGVLAAPKGSRALAELEEAARAVEALGGTALDAVPLPVAADAPSMLVLLVRRTGELDDRYPRRAGMPSKRPL
jgi:16S rRNA (guanine527-N7)-methyltransferase